MDQLSPLNPALHTDMGPTAATPGNESVRRADCALTAEIEAPSPPSLLAGHQALGVPAVVAAAGDPAAMRFIEFFTANIRNPNTRAAYARAVMDFFAWCERHGRAVSFEWLTAEFLLPGIFVPIRVPPVECVTLSR